jgi:hypothetical protein
MRWEGHTAHMGQMRNAYNIGRCKHRWKDNIKIDRKEIGYEDVD